MNGAQETEQLSHVRRKLRVIGILFGAYRAGLVPLSAHSLQTACYFADALAPVWGVRILDARLLKRRDSPNSPVIQADVDRLVGVGVLVATNVRHREDADGLWRLDSDYTLNPGFAEPILEAARGLEKYEHEINFLGEVVLALSGFGALNIDRASASDASYGNEMIDPGGMVDLDAVDGNQTARVAMRFGELAPPDFSLSDSEKVHLYLRELYARAGTAQ